MDLSVARNAIEMLYTDTCTVFEYRDVENPVTCITSKQLVGVDGLVDVPCRLSTSRMNKTAADGVAPSISQTMKLILAPEININAGSRIVITRNGVTTAYRRSGEPARYTNHQEIMLELEEEYA